MPTRTLIVGSDNPDTLVGSAGNELIYGFNPDGPQAQVSSITATRVAAGLSQPLFAVAPPGDYNRLFLVEKTGQIKILDLNTGQISSNAVPRSLRSDQHHERGRSARPRLRSGFRA